MTPQLCRNPLTGELVAIVPGRATRPGATGRTTRDVPATDCPFCEGHEAMTPPEVAAAGRTANAPADSPGWTVRVVPNKFPAFTGQEVVVHGPRHAVRISDIAEGVLEVAISVWGERRRAHAAAGAVYVLTGINEGAGAGASLDHSHSQIVPFAEPPPVVLAEAEAFDSAPCPLCESGGATRHLIRHADGLQTFAPHWARTPYETWIAPDAHLSEVAGADSLAAALRDLSRRLRALLGDDLSWNAILHEAPPAATVGAWHWHMEVMPRLTVPALTEYGAGIWVNVIEPARAAQDLAIALP